MTDYFTLVSVLFPVGSAANVAPALAIYQQFATELEERGECIGFHAKADDPPGGADLWLHADESADIENIIAFALRCAGVLDLQGLWGFRWGLTASRPVLDGYGGGAQLLDLGARKSVSWVDCEHWLVEEAARISAPAGTAQDILDPVAIQQGWTWTTSASVMLDFLDREIATDPDVARRFRAHLAEASVDPGEMLCRECGMAMFIENSGVSHHAGDEGKEGIDYNRDLDHVAVAEREP